MAGEQFRRIGSRLFTLALAGPAAIHILGKLNEKLEFSDTLTRIVLNFRAVTRAFWEFLFALVPSLPPIKPDILTLFTLLLVPTLLQKPTLRDSEDGMFYIRLSLAFTYLAMLGFWPTTMSISSLGIISLMFVALVEIQVRLYPRGFRSFRTVPFYQWAGFGVLYTIVYLVIGYFLTGDMEGAINLGLFSLVVALIFMIAVQNIYRGAAGPLYILLAAAGMIAIDWLSRVAKPAVDGWLSGIGV